MIWLPKNTDKKTPVGEHTDEYRRMYPIQCMLSAADSVPVEDLSKAGRKAFRLAIGRAKKLFPTIVHKLDKVKLTQRWRTVKYPPRDPQGRFAYDKDTVELTYFRLGPRIGPSSGHPEGNPISQNVLEAVICHEVAHVVLNAMFKGCYRKREKIINDNAFNARALDDELITEALTLLILPEDIQAKIFKHHTVWGIIGETNIEPKL